jgi:hypothetical protein
VIVTTATAPADWTAQAHRSSIVVTQVFRQGVRYGEVHEISEGYTVAWPRHRTPEIFLGPGSVERAWQYVMPSPLSPDLRHRLQDEADKNGVVPF